MGKCKGVPKQGEEIGRGKKGGDAVFKSQYRYDLWGGGLDVPFVRVGTLAIENTLRV